MTTPTPSVPPPADTPAPSVEAMKKDKHTPIPWTQEGVHIVAYVDEDHDSKGGNICTVGEPRASNMVGFTALKFGSPEFKEAHANAAFIVEACNNYERVKAELATAQQAQRDTATRAGMAEELAGALAQMDLLATREGWNTPLFVAEYGKGVRESRALLTRYAALPKGRL